MPSTGIRHLSAYGRGWMWDYTDPNTGRTDLWHTAASGEGLWRSDRQLLGLTQFNLPATRAAAYAKIRRYHLHGRQSWYD